MNNKPGMDKIIGELLACDFGAPRKASIQKRIEQQLAETANARPAAQSSPLFHMPGQGSPDKVELSGDDLSMVSAAGSPDDIAEDGVDSGDDPKTPHK